MCFVNIHVTEDLFENLFYHSNNLPTAEQSLLMFCCTKNEDLLWGLIMGHG